MLNRTEGAKGAKVTTERTFPDGERTVHKFGLDLTPEDFDDLGDRFEEIKQAEQRAVRESCGGIVIF